jgi:hypothetical protein
MRKIILTESQLSKLITKIISEQEQNNLFDTLNQKYNFVTSNNNSVYYKGAKKIKYFDKESNREKFGKYSVQIVVNNDSSVDFYLFIPPGYKSYEGLIDKINNVINSMGGTEESSKENNFRDGQEYVMSFTNVDLNNPEFFTLVSEIQKTIR